MTNLLYSKEHEWIQQLEGNKVRIGISAYAQKQLGDIVFVEVPATDAHIEADASVGTIESVKAVSEIYTPVSGVVVAVNDTLEDSPEIINEDPYTDGWLFEVEMTNAEELTSLFNKEAYEQFIEEGEA